MIASLPMYDWPELASSSDALWTELARRLRKKGIDAPENLTRTEDDTSSALAPDLLLGQTCGYPLATRLKSKVQYLTTPEYDVEGCDGPNYSSALLVHKDSQIDLQTTKDTRFAFNSDNSLSGYRCVGAIFGQLENHFGELIQSGGHRHSARMVANGAADVAALDAVCWHMLQRFEPETAVNLKIIGWTELRPTLPFITSLDTGSKTVANLRTVLRNVLSPKHKKSAWSDLAIAGTRELQLSEYNKLSSL